MTTHTAVKIVTFEADGDLSDKLGYCVALSTEAGDTTPRVKQVSSLTEIPIGVVAEEAEEATDGSPVGIALFSGGGVLIGHAAGTITRGQVLATNATGGIVGQAVVANRAMVGTAAEAAANGQTFMFVPTAFLSV